MTDVGMTDVGMTPASKNARARNPRARVTEICLALPEATQQDSGRHAAFLVRNKKFAYYHDVGRVDWDEVDELVVDSYLSVAPKRLAALVEAESG
jgi:hypothetical protein